METWLFAAMIDVIMNMSPDRGRSGFVNWKRGKTLILMRINRVQFWEGADEDEKWMLRSVSKWTSIYFVSMQYLFSTV